MAQAEYMTSEIVELPLSRHAAVENVTKLTDSATGAIDWTYDVLDRVTQEVTPQGIVHYTYDAISQRLTMRANAQPPVTYGYDANSQLSNVTQGTLSATLTHDALGRRTQLQRSNGVTTTYNYDPASRLLGITHAKGTTTLEQLTQGFDPADNKTQATQLIQTATALPPAVTAAYNAVNAQIQFNSGTLGYDPNGNLTTDGTTTYVWDARDRLIGISGSTSATFGYDALDRRIAKTINGSTTSYVYNGVDIAIEAGASNASYLSTLNIDEPLVRQTSTGNEGRKGGQATFLEVFGVARVGAAWSPSPRWPRWWLARLGSRRVVVDSRRCVGR